MQQDIWVKEHDWKSNIAVSLAYVVKNVQYNAYYIL